MATRFRLSLVFVAVALIATACVSDAEPTAVSSRTSTTIATPATTTSTTTAVPTTAPETCPTVFCVVYHIRTDARWSDGVPVTANDFLFTHEMLTDPVRAPRTDGGYGLISTALAPDAKTAVFGFDEVYAPWRTLFPVVLPAHVLDGVSLSEDPLTALQTTAGPFVLESWIEGDRIVLNRNRGYWASQDPVSGSPLGDIEEIQIVFPDSVRDMLAGLEDGEIDVAGPRPLAWMIEETASMDEVRFDLTPGPFWEHIDFNHDDPLLAQLWVRQVIDLAIDRGAILDATARMVDPDSTPLDSTVWPTNSSHYEPHYVDRFDPESAERALQDHHCEKLDDGIYSCQGRRMSFTWASSVGDEFRETQFELVRESLGSIGIEVVPRFMTPSELFSSEVAFGGPEVWQIINFAWKAGADPYLANGTYQCSGSAPNGFGALNVNRYCDEEVDHLISGTDLLTEPEDRAAAYNRADALYLDDLAVIPLYQKPVFLAWNATLRGPEPNISRATDLWNVAAWTGKSTIVIALETEPEPADPLLPRDSDLALILAPLLHGAYGVSPGLEFVPVLVESTEIIVSDD